MVCDVMRRCGVMWRVVGCGVWCDVVCGVMWCVV